MDKELSKKIEAILFYTAEPVELKNIVKIFDTDREEILEALKDLENNLNLRGIRLVRREDEFLLSTAPEYSELIEKMIKDERSKELGRASLETLSIVAYKGPVRKSEIEYIRGVNCDYAIRQLLLRGLVDKRVSEEDERVVLYSLTVDALLHLGLSRIDDLPEYKDIRGNLEVKEENQERDGE